MSKRRISGRTPTLAAESNEGPPISAGAEAGVRQLLASGDYKTALERAKEIHRACGTPVSEALLIDVYAERIRALLRRNLTLEAHSLVELVRQRYPSARKRLAELTSGAARPASLHELVRPLNDPALDAAARASIERTIQQDVSDLAALAGCDALPADHSLRQAASALERAFVAVTSGPIGEDTLALPDVSRRSPLASWKLLVRAIASFYAGDDAACERSLVVIGPASKPARLVPVIRAMLGGGGGTTLGPAATALATRVAGRPSALRSTLEALDQAFTSESKGRILKAVRAAIEACRQSSPAQIDFLRQLISVRCAVADLEAPKVAAAMGGPSRHDAAFTQLFARAMEETRDPEKVVMACKLWEDFRHQAAAEGWFAANGLEAAALSLHIAKLLQQVPQDLLLELQRSARAKAKAGGDKQTFLFPEEQYQRACVLDPHPEAFSQWMEWASRHARGQVGQVAAEWHRIRPKDIDPILRLLQDAEARGHYRSALGYLWKVEQLDSLYPRARSLQLRLLARSALAHLQQKKPGLAADDLTAMAALPQAQQGDRPALLAALRVVASADRGQDEEAARCRGDVERILDCRAAAALLVFAVATAAKRRELGRLEPVKKLSKAERSALPAALARVAVLTADLRVTIEIPDPWMNEVARHFPASGHTLEADQLRALGELALLRGHGTLAYVVSAAGLERGGAAEAGFLLLRARAITENFTRRVVCAKAAAELARQQQDPELVEEAIDLVRVLFEFDEAPLTIEQAREVLRQERAEPDPPSRKRPGPTYGQLANECQCPECRRARGAIGDPFDDFDFDDDDLDDEEDAGFVLPPDMPPEIAEMFLQEAEKGLRRGESFDAFMARLLAEKRPARPRKGRTRR